MQSQEEIKVTIKGDDEPRVELTVEYQRRNAIVINRLMDALRCFSRKPQCLRELDNPSEYITLIQHRLGLTRQRETQAIKIVVDNLRCLVNPYTAHSLIGSLNSIRYAVGNPLRMSNEMYEFLAELEQILAATFAHNTPSFGESFP